jgi:hypothetical protein
MDISFEKLPCNCGYYHKFVVPILPKYQSVHVGAKTIPNGLGTERAKPARDSRIGEVPPRKPMRFERECDSNGDDVIDRNIFT